jgi:hypothetical protein
MADSNRPASRRLSSYRQIVVVSVVHTGAFLAFMRLVNTRIPDHLA